MKIEWKCIIKWMCIFKYILPYFTWASEKSSKHNWWRQNGLFERVQKEEFNLIYSKRWLLFERKTTLRSIVHGKIIIIFPTKQTGRTRVAGTPDWMTKAEPSGFLLTSNRLSGWTDATNVTKEGRGLDWTRQNSKQGHSIYFSRSKQHPTGSLERLQFWRKKRSY